MKRGIKQRLKKVIMKRGEKRKKERKERKGRNKIKKEGK